MLCQAVPRSPPRFSEHTARVCGWYLLLWPIPAAPALQKTCNHLSAKAHHASHHVSKSGSGSGLSLSVMTVEVELVTAMVRRPADRQRCLAAFHDKGIGLAGEEPGPRAIAVLVCGRVESRVAPRRPSLRGNHKDVVNSHVLVEVSRLELAQIGVLTACGAVETGVGRTLRIFCLAMAIDPATTDELVIDVAPSTTTRFYYVIIGLP